ncbi:MAG: LacI family transcriptional regulator [Pirellulales bacterium]|nr:LacI family transcriptional regulator [Pirellulales bacterium]
MNSSEVARRAGVSQSTVSRVLNRRPGVTPEKTRAVREAIRELGFQPRDRRPRDKASRRARCVAVLVVDENYMNNPTVSALKMRGATQSLKSHGFNVVFSQVAEPEDLPPMVEDRLVEGVLLWGQSSPAWLAEHLEGTPTAWLSSHFDANGESVLMGNRSVGRLAAEYLVDNGCRNLAFLAPECGRASHNARREGFEFAAHRGGVTCEAFVEPVKFDNGSSPTNWQAIENCVENLLSTMLAHQPGIDGLFIPDDQITAIAHRLLKLRGVDLRRRLRLVSANNDLACLAGLDPRPASIDVGPEITGHLAAEQLLWAIRNPNYRDERRAQVVVEPILIPGDARD